MIGITNDLIVTGPNDDIFITTSLPFADNKEGRKHDFYTNMKITIPLLIDLKMTYIYHCESNHLRNTHYSSVYKCKKVSNTEAASNSNNGMLMMNKII